MPGRQALCCVSCGSPLRHAPTGRPRRFCSQACRQRDYARRRSTVTRSRNWRDNWHTPEQLRLRVLSEHPISLDAAACADSALVPNYLGPDHEQVSRRDALQCDWASLAGGGVIWLNPPYSAPLLQTFLATAIATVEQGTTVLSLLPVATSSRWWFTFVTSQPCRVEFIPYRLAFGGPHASGRPAPFASALVSWGR